MKNNRKRSAGKILLISVIVIIIVSNTPPLQYFLLENYSYQNKDGSFKYIEEPGKALDFTIGKIRFNRFIEENPLNENKTLYRTFTIKPWQFWEWWQYIAHSERYTLPYLQIK